MRKWLTVNDFKKACMAGLAESESDRVRKGVIAHVKRSAKKSELGGTMLDFKISDGSVDRDNDTIDPKGWTLKNYKSNPVVLWAHDYDTPAVARSVVSRTDDALFAEAEFTPKDLNPFGHMVGELYAHGFQRAASVGFIPSEWTESAERSADTFYPGLDFSKQDLLEWSTVPVPSNPMALQGAKSLGIDLGPMTDWAERILDGERGPGLWLPAKDAERIYAACKAGGVVIDLKAAPDAPEPTDDLPDVDPADIEFTTPDAPAPSAEPAPGVSAEPSADPAEGDGTTAAPAFSEDEARIVGAAVMGTGSRSEAIKVLMSYGWGEMQVRGLFSSSSHFDHAHALQLSELTDRVGELEVKADGDGEDDDSKGFGLELVADTEAITCTEAGCDGCDWAHAKVSDPVMIELGDEDDGILELSVDEAQQVVTAATRQAIKNFKRTVLGRLD